MTNVGTFGPAQARTGCRTVTPEVIDVLSELVLAEMVRAWADRQLPGDAGAANRAAAIAEAAYAGGASVSEACRQAQAFVGSWSRHPSRVPVAGNPLVPLAS